MNWIQSLYVGATIFGVGVTLADLIGAFSNLTEGGESDSGEADGELDDVDVDDVGDGDDGDADFDEGGGDDTEGDALDEADAGAEGTASSSSTTTPSVIAHDVRRRKSTLLRLLTVLRSLVYFALGFGPVGWFATTQYARPEATLAWSLPVGFAIMILARGLRKLFRKDLSSDVHMTDLLMEKGHVTVSIGKGLMGKARITIGGVYVERFARAKDDETEIRVGTPIRVIDANDECVFVEEEA